MLELTRRDLGRLAGAALAPVQARPNVVIVLADDQGYGDISAHGHPEIRTPWMDRLHAESVRFTDFHSSPMCTPTRAQLMTGCDALRTSAINVSSGRTLLRTDLPTMADAFGASGYRTGLFGKWHLGDTYPYRPMDRGFQESVWYASSHIGSVPDAWQNDYFNDRYRHNAHLQQYRGYSGDVFFDQAMQWMRASRNAGAPFFSYIPLNVAHSPLFVPPQFIEPYRHLPQNIARYSAMVANIDYNLGRLDAMLTETGLRDNTILIYMSDNGATRGTLRFNAGMKGVKTELYEGGHRVPCFVRWKAGGVVGGRDVSDLAQMQDLFPTMIDLCGLKRPARFAPDGISLAPILQGKAKQLPDRTAVVQFSRMNAQRPAKDDAAVMWKKWRLIGGKELYDVAADPGQEKNVFAGHPDIVARLQRHYDAWWKGVEPRLDTFQPVVVGAERENPVLASACEWADVFLDQGAQVRNGVKKNGAWHVHVSVAGDYCISLRRWPRECDAAISAGIPPHKSEDIGYPAGVALPIAFARLKIGGFDQTIAVKADDREAVFTMTLPAGRTQMQSWFLDAGRNPILGAYYAYVERTSPVSPSTPVRVLFDTDIMGDVDDVGAVALLHALVSRGEAAVLAMGVCSKHPASSLCLDALNHYFGRPGIVIGVNKGDGALRDSRYAAQIAGAWPHRLKSAADAPDAVAVYRRTLAAQPDGGVVLITVGQLSNVASLLRSKADAHSPLSGVELARRKVREWVCMGARFPEGREANVFRHAEAARYAVENWPGRIVFSGYEIGAAIMTGARTNTLPPTSPVRKAYERYNNGKHRESWDQTAVLYGVRCTAQDRGLWTLSPPGTCLIKDDGSNTWREHPEGRHQHLLARTAPAQLATLIEELMLHQPKPKIL